MLLKPLIQDFKKDIRHLKKIAADFESGAINPKTLLAKITEIKKTFPLDALENSLEHAFVNPDNLRKKTINEACVILCTFKARMLATMTATMQKLMAIRPRIPLRRYGGNVVETTPAALTVALEYANKMAAERSNKNLDLDFLASFKASIEQLENLIAAHNNNIVTTANIRSSMTEMLPMRHRDEMNATASKQPTDEETK